MFVHARESDELLDGNLLTFWSDLFRVIWGETVLRSRHVIPHEASFNKKFLLNFLEFILFPFYSSTQVDCIIRSCSIENS